MKPFLYLFICCLSTLAYGQGVGIGTNSPSDALHIISENGIDPFRVQITLPNGNQSTKFRLLENGGATLGANNVSGTPTDGLYVHGNTGMGIGSPSERLVVNGNIDVKGELKADGLAGQAGQFLTPDGSGNMVWSSINKCDFTNVVHYPDHGTYTFTVPADVTLIQVELWGAGGRGWEGGGGGGGCYVNALIKTIPGSDYDVIVGESGSVTDFSKINLTSSPAIQATALAGLDASQFIPGQGGVSSIAPGMNAYFIRGETGTIINKSFQQKSSTVFYEIIKYGDGGAAGQNSSRSRGRFQILNADTGTNVEFYLGEPGGIGAGGPGSVAQMDGTDGYVIIRW